jgi:hypothetical protein
MNKQERKQRMIAATALADKFVDVVPDDSETLNVILAVAILLVFFAKVLALSKDEVRSIVDDLWDSSPETDGLIKRENKKLKARLN